MQDMVSLTVCEQGLTLAAKTEMGKSKACMEGYSRGQVLRSKTCTGAFGTDMCIAMLQTHRILDAFRMRAGPPMLNT